MLENAIEKFRMQFNAALSYANINRIREPLCTHKHFNAHFLLVLTCIFSKKITSHAVDSLFVGKH